MSQTLELLYTDRRLTMSASSIFLTRALTSIFYLVFAALTFIFVFSDLPALRGFGFFFLFVWIDLIFHWQDGRKLLRELPKDGIVNLFEYSRPELADLIEKTHFRGRFSGDSLTLSLLHECLKGRTAQGALRRLDIDPREFSQKLQELLLGEKEESSTPQSLASFFEQEFLQKMISSARTLGHRYLENSDLFLALFSTGDPHISRLKKMFGLEERGLLNALILEALVSEVRNAQSRPPLFRRRKESPQMNRAWTALQTPYLDTASTDLTALAFRGQGRHLIGHARELDLLFQTLARSLRPNALLVGEAGVGKETLIQHLAYLIVTDQVPETLRDKRLVALHLGALVSGGTPQETQARLQRVVEEILATENIILYIPDLHLAYKTSGHDFMSLGETLLPILKHEAFPVIGTTTPQDFILTLEKQSDLVQLFERLDIPEISTEETEEFLLFEAARLEALTRITFTSAAVHTAAVTAKKYFAQKRLPGSALELLREAADEAKKREEKTLHQERVLATAENKTNVPLHIPKEKERQTLLHLEELMHQEFIGQEEAVRAVADALREYRSGLTHRGGPIASFLFVGPTGVGKTALAKLLAKLQFGGTQAFLRFDMSEYQDSKSVFQFLGSPDGTLSGALTEAVRHQPFGVLLLDEFEKSHPDILNLFLQVLDDGRLTDSLGRTVDFQNMIIVATSNAQSEFVEESLRENKPLKEVEEELRHRLFHDFKPELLNRFSKIVIFKNLSPQEALEVTRLGLVELKDELAEKGFTLEVSEEALTWLTKVGFDRALGARPLSRAIEEHLRAPLAKLLLTETFSPGSTIAIELKGEEISFVEKEH